MRAHPLEDYDDDDERADPWAALILLIMLALAAGIACAIWDGAIDAWHFLSRKARR